VLVEGLGQVEVRAGRDPGLPGGDRDPVRGRSGGVFVGGTAALRFGAGQVDRVSRCSAGAIDQVGTVARSSSRPLTCRAKVRTGWDRSAGWLLMSQT